MSRNIAVLFVALAMLVLFGTSASAKMAKPCSAANGSPVSASLPVCIAGFAFGGIQPGTISKVQIAVSSMTSTTLPAVKVVDIMPKGAKALSSTKPYKLVNGRPTWVIKNVRSHVMTFFVLKMRSPVLAPGKIWCNVLTGAVVGQKAVSKTPPSCNKVVAPTG